MVVAASVAERAQILGLSAIELANNMQALSAPDLADGERLWPTSPAHNQRP